MNQHRGSSGQARQLHQKSRAGMLHVPVAAGRSTNTAVENKARHRVCSQMSSTCRQGAARAPLTSEWSEGLLEFHCLTGHSHIRETAATPLGQKQSVNRLHS